jgi:RNA polymerase sigma-70 factor (ECF subfamily)
MTDSINSELIVRAQRGNAEAVGRLYEENHQSIFRYLSYRTTDLQTAEDLTSEVFLKMVQALPGYLPKNVPFKAWLFRIARNLAIDHQRRNNTHPTINIEENMPIVDNQRDQNMEDCLDSIILKHALARLNDEQRDVILMRFVEGMPIVQVAMTLHKSEDAIKGLQRRALNAIRTNLYFKEGDRAGIG